MMFLGIAFLALLQAAPSFAADGKGMLVEKEHIVKKADTLWDIAGMYYSDPFKWGVIYNANAGRIKDPDLIYPGERVVIPGLEERIKPAEPANKPSMERVYDDGAGEVKVPETLPRARSAEKHVLDAPAPQFSEEMPENQVEWNEILPTVLVDSGWKDDGFVAGKKGGMEDSVMFTGDVLNIRVKRGIRFREGSVADIYKKGERLRNGARKIQKIAECRIVSARGRKAECLITTANGSVMRGLSVKFK